jgi:hyperosmotically inducible protein
MNTLMSKTLFRSTLVTTCLAAALGIGTAKAASDDASMPQPQSKNMGAAISDTVITGKVKAALMGEDDLKHSHIHVTTTNGVVTLDGTASSSDAKVRAEDVTKSIDSVKSVDNNLRTPGSSNAVAKTKRVVSDSWITAKVKSEILADSLSKGFDVTVETKHGVVVLKGTLPNQDAVDHVERIAEKVKGVKSVDGSALTVEAK